MNQSQINESTQEYVKTGHFLERQRQRHIHDTQVALAIQYGQPFYQGQEKVYFLGRKQLQRAARVLGARLSCKDVKDADGTVVVVADDHSLVTTYRNPNYIRHLRRCDS